MKNSLKLIRKSLFFLLIIFFILASARNPHDTNAKVPDSSNDYAKSPQIHSINLNLTINIYDIPDISNNSRSTRLYLEIHANSTVPCFLFVYDNSSLRNYWAFDTSINVLDSQHVFFNGLHVFKLRIFNQSAEAFYENVYYYQVKSISTNIEQDLDVPPENSFFGNSNVDLTFIVMGVGASLAASAKTVAWVIRKGRSRNNYRTPSDKKDPSQMQGSISGIKDSPFNEIMQSSKYSNEQKFELAQICASIAEIRVYKNSFPNIVQRICTKPQMYKFIKNNRIESTIFRLKDSDFCLDYYQIRSNSMTFGFLPITSSNKYFITFIFTNEADDQSIVSLSPLFMNLSSKYVEKLDNLVDISRSSFMDLSYQYFNLILALPIRLEKKLDPTFKYEDAVIVDTILGKSHDKKERDSLAVDLNALDAITIQKIFTRIVDSNFNDDYEDDLFD